MYKGTSPKAPRPPPKRKPEPAPAKGGKKTPTSAGKKLKKSPSDEIVDDEANVYNQTCNVIVERIVEEDKKVVEVRDSKSKFKSPRQRDRTASPSIKKLPGASEEKQEDSVLEEKSTTSSPVKRSKVQEPGSPVPTKTDRETRKSKKAAAANATSGSKDVIAVESKDNNPHLSTSKKLIPEKERPSYSSTPSKPSPEKEPLPVVPEVGQKLKDGKSSLSLQVDAQSGSNNLTAPSKPTVENVSSSNSSTKSTIENLVNKSASLFKDDHKGSSAHDSIKRSGLVTGSVSHEVKALPTPTSSHNPQTTKDKISKESVVQESPQEGSSNKSKGSSIGDDSEEGSMYYKKHKILRTGGPSPSSMPSSVSEGINVNISLTDQLTKRNRSNVAINGESGKAGLGTPVSLDNLSPPNPLPYSPSVHRERGDTANLSKVHDFVGERPSAFSSVSRSSAVLGSRTSEDRADSRSSDSQLSGHLEDKRPGSRVEDIRSSRSSPGSSPLIVDKHDAVHPYRDPILMRNNTVQSNVPNMLAAGQHLIPPVVHQGSPAGAPPPPPSAAQTVAAATAGTFPPGVPRGLLNALPIPTTHPYSAGHPLPASISHHLNMQHGYSDALRAQQQHILLAQHQQQLIAGYPALGPMEVWQKLQSQSLTQWPPALQKNAESLLAAGDYAALQREQLIHIENDRREFERRETDRLEKELLREKERKEMLER